MIQDGNQAVHHARNQSAFQFFVHMKHPRKFDLQRFSIGNTCKLYREDLDPSCRGCFSRLIRRLLRFQAFNCPSRYYC